MQWLPYAGYDSGEFVGTSLLAVDETSIAHIPGIVKLVVIGDFIGIVAEREEQAIKAAQALQVSWKDWPQFAADDRRSAARQSALDPGGAMIPAMWTRRWRRPTGVSPAATCGRISVLPDRPFLARWRTNGRSTCRSIRQPEPAPAARRSGLAAGVLQRRSRSFACKRPVMAAIAPMTSAPTRRCCRARWAGTAGAADPRTRTCVGTEGHGAAMEVDGG